MGHRSEILAIAKDICHSFESRNNDYCGTWALGRLLKLSINKGSNVIEIDLLRTESTEICETLLPISKRYSSMLLEQLSGKRLDIGCLRSALIKVTFNLTESRISPSSEFYIEHSFKIQVCIKDDIDHEYIGEEKGWCFSQ